MFEHLLRLFTGDPAAAARALREAELSHDQVRSALRDALKASLTAAGMDKVYAWPKDVYDDRVVYEVEMPTGTRLFSRGYSIDEAGAVTLGDDVTEVKAQTVYTPVSPPTTSTTMATESADEPAAEGEPLVEAEITDEWSYEPLTEAPRTFSAEQRRQMAASGVAMRDGSFPIPDRDALRRAIASFGRGGDDKAAIKAHIIKRARALKATDMLPEDWTGREAAVSESEAPVSEAESELVGDVIPLVEKAVRRDGTVPLKIIQPGWGASGYYDAKVLERDGPKVFTKGLKMYWDHPTQTEEAERPERSLRDLAAEFVGNARFDKNGAAGPGLYADAKVFKPYRETVEELAPHIGVSIRALGSAKHGTAEGKSGPIVESLVAAQSVDFVTTPGAGGQVLQLFEAARGRAATPAPQTTQEDTPVGDELSESVRQRFEAQETETARLREALLFREARDVATAAIASYDLPDVTRARLVESLAKNPPVTESKALDVEAFTTRCTEAVKAEVEYLAKAAGIGDGQVRGMGSSGTTEPMDEAASEAALAGAFGALGLSESAAKIAAGGREH